MNLIITRDLSGGIRYRNKVPWHIPEERAYFDHVTSFTRCSSKKNALIMGRRTWESLDNPYPNRINIIISTTVDYPSGIQTNPEVFVRTSVTEAVSLAKSLDVENIWFIGGQRVYQDCLKYCKRLFIIDIHGQFICDIFSPKIDLSAFTCIAEQYNNSQMLIYSKHIYEKKINTNEQKYLTMIQTVLSRGYKREDRTGCGTLSIFGCVNRYDLTDNKIPLLTTKKMFWRGIVEELLWFIRGETNNLTLKEKNVNIWTPNTNGNDDLGPIYGFQWRHFGAEYVDCFTDYSGKGIDQLSNCLDLIKNNPISRRNIMLAWNPSDNSKMALPPCHCLVQFYVNENQLSALVFQRSGDIGLGVPFNIASYSLLIHILAVLSNKTAFELIHVIGDAHIYSNHIEQLTEQTLRIPNQCPSISFKRIPEKIEDLTYEDITLENYTSYDPIVMEVNV
jgi:thymidylate synthase